MMNQATSRSIFRCIHIIFAIPIVGYIYSPFEKLPDYAFLTRYVFLPGMVLTGIVDVEGACCQATYFEEVDPAFFEIVRLLGRDLCQPPSFHKSKLENYS